MEPLENTPRQAVRNPLAQPLQHKQAKGRSISPPPFELTANEPVQAKSKEDKKQGRNVLFEKVPDKNQPKKDVPGEWYEDGPNEVPKWARERMDKYAKRLKPLIAPWDKVRGTPECSKADLSKLTKVYEEFRHEMIIGPKLIRDDEEQWRKKRDATGFATPKDAFWGDKAWSTYMRLQLGSAWLTSVREARAFIPTLYKSAPSIFIMEELDLKPLKVGHKYELQVVTAVEAAAGPDIGIVGAKGHTMHGTFFLTYTNNLGMKWTQTLWISTAGVEVSGGARVPAPIDGNVVSSHGGKAVNFGESKSVRTYFSPNDVKGDVETRAFEAQMGPAGMGTGQIIFRENGRRLVIDNSGLSVKYGTAALNFGGASVTVTRGGAGELSHKHLSGMKRKPVKTKTPSKRKPKPLPKKRDVNVLSTVLHFPTQSSKLDGSDKRAVRLLLDRLLAREKQHPGELSSIQFVAAASKRYRKPGRKSTPADKNDALAGKRNEHTQSYFEELWMDKYEKEINKVAPKGWQDKVDFDQKIVPQSTLKDLDAENNDPKYRAGAILVHFHTRVQYNNERHEFVD